MEEVEAEALGSMEEVEVPRPLVKGRRRLVPR
jgi:hypothetical protein